MGLKLITAPATEPVTLTEVKQHLRLDSLGLSADITPVATIPQGIHPVTTAAYTLLGTAVDVLGYTSMTMLEPGAIYSAGGTVDVKLQDSSDNTTWVDVASGAFTQLTTASITIQEKDYSGGKQYLRAVASVNTGASEFSVLVLKDAPYSTEDTLLSALIVAAREYAENYQNRALVTQTWELVLDNWPKSNFDAIEIPLPPLQSVSSIKYKDAAGAETTWDAANYIVDTDSFCGCVALTYGNYWPTATLYPVGAIRIRFIAGYTTIPQRVKQAMLMLISHWYENRESTSEKTVREIPFAVESLLGQVRVVSI